MSARLLSFIALALVAAFSSAVAQGPVALPPRTPESAVTPTLVPNSLATKRHPIFLDRIKDGPVGLLLIGDSITDFWPKVGEYSYLKLAPYQPADFGISGERTEQVLWRLLNGELEGITPKVAIVMIGTNNIGQFPDEKPEWVAAGIKRIVETVRQKLPDTKVLLLGVFPRGMKGSPAREAVTKINQIISTFGDGDKTRYLDISDRFLDAQGEIPVEIMPDRLHPSAKGYDIWYAAIHPTLMEMMK